MSSESSGRKSQENGRDEGFPDKEVRLFAIPFEEFVNVASLSELRRTLTKEEKQELKRILKEELSSFTKTKQ